MTPKQVLRAHVTGEHRGAPARATLVELARWHARQHHRLACSHYHAGVNRGPDQRPPGWYTGEDSVPINDKVLDSQSRSW